MIERLPKNEGSIGSEREDFFEQARKNTKIFSSVDYEKVYSVAKKAWGIDSPAFVLPRSYFAKHPYPEVLPQTIEGEVLIAINGEVVSDPDFIRYLEHHEYWEQYVVQKKGFNFMARNFADYQLPVLQRNRPAHRVATLKELKLASAEGKLNEYMEWWKSFYQRNMDEVRALSDEEILRISLNYKLQGNVAELREAIISRIQKNLDLKLAIFEKIKKQASRVSCQGMIETRL